MTLKLDSIIRVEMGAQSARPWDSLLRDPGAQTIPCESSSRKTALPPQIRMDSATKEHRFGRAGKRLWLLITAVLVTVFAGGMLFVFLPLGKLLIDRQAKPISPRVAVATIAFSSDTPGLDYLVTPGCSGELVGILAEFNWLTVFRIPSQINQSTKRFPV